MNRGRERYERGCCGRKRAAGVSTAGVGAAVAGAAGASRWCGRDVVCKILCRECEVTTRGVSRHEILGRRRVSSKCKRLIED